MLGSQAGWGATTGKLHDIIIYPHSYASIALPSTFFNFNLSTSISSNARTCSDPAQSNSLETQKAESMQLCTHIQCRIFIVKPGFLTYSTDTGPALRTEAVPDPLAREQVELQRVFARLPRQFAVQSVDEQVCVAEADRA